MLLSGGGHGRRRLFKLCKQKFVIVKKQYQAVTAAEAVKVIKSGDHVHISSVSNVPQCLVKALCDRDRDRKSVV